MGFIQILQHCPLRVSSSINEKGEIMHTTTKPDRVLKRLQQVAEQLKIIQQQQLLHKKSQPLIYHWLQAAEKKFHIPKLSKFIKKGLPYQPKKWEYSPLPSPTTQVQLSKSSFTTTTESSSPAKTSSETEPLKSESTLLNAPIPQECAKKSRWTTFKSVLKISFY